MRLHTAGNIGSIRVQYAAVKVCFTRSGFLYTMYIDALFCRYDLSLSCILGCMYRRIAVENKETSTPLILAKYLKDTGENTPDVVRECIGPVSGRTSIQVRISKV